MQAKTADNSLFDRLSHSWWDANGFFHMLKTCSNPWRTAYFERVLTSNRLSPSRLTLLDVGCGGGFLAEEFSAMGFSVTGVDRSEESIAVARKHAKDSGLSINYQAAHAESLPFGDLSFDLVACCDVLEHIYDWKAVLKEISRTLKPGGVLLYDTINRTAASRLIFIDALQNCPMTRIAPRDLHVWHMFIKPEELATSLDQAGLQPRHVEGARLSTGMIQAFLDIRKHKRGHITAAELGQRLKYLPSRNLSLSYVGYATKHPSRP